MMTIFKRALIVAIVTNILDFLFHLFLTNPMESLTYFVIKFLLAFFVATAMFSSRLFIKKVSKRKFIIPLTGLVFSTLMSIYYRSWELGEAHVPFGSRAPDIMGIPRENLILFSGTWWLGHALFFCISCLVAIKIVKEKRKDY